MRRSGEERPASANASATAEPRPPIIVWFSAVTTIRLRLASATIVPVSRGLIDWRIDDRGGDAVLFQRAPRRQRGRDHHASRDDQRIAVSVPPQDLCSGKIEAVVGLKDNRRFTALEAHIDRPKWSAIRFTA